MPAERLERGARGRSAERSPARIGIAIAVAMGAAACVGVGSDLPPALTPGTTAPTGAPSQATATPGEVLLVSSVMPFQLLLPPGWVVFGAGLDEQSFGTADAALTLVVGRARIEPGQSVSDRVAFNRTTEFRGCESDPSLDRPITIDGEPGILWSMQCAGRINLAANTIHEGLGYRLLLQPSSSATLEGLDPVLRAFVAGFQFTD